MTKQLFDIYIEAGLVRELFDYDQDTGLFRNRFYRNGRAQAGRVAGCRSGDGYWRLKIEGSNVMAHRAAWCHFYGAWPLQEIDHIDGDRLNNRITNLREASRSLNMQNQRRPMKHNASGFLGVVWIEDRRRWKASIKLDGRTHFLGYFVTPEDASIAYLDAKRLLHPGSML